MSQEVDRRDFLKTAGVGAGAALTVGSNLLQKGGGMAEAATTPETYMSKPLIPIDLTKSPKDQVLPLHNRWHPDIPPVVTLKPRAVFRVECYDWTGGQIKNDDSANDIRDVELPQVHYLSGPIAVEGAEPGDILSEYLVFEGISVDEQGKQYYLDPHISYRRACLNAIEYMKKFGFSGEQGYMLISTAPCEGKISGIVDIPNACCTLHVPTEIFDFDIRPSAAGPISAPRGAVSSTT